MKNIRTPQGGFFFDSHCIQILSMVNGNHGHITYRLRNIIMYKGWKLPFSTTVFWL